MVMRVRMKLHLISGECGSDMEVNEDGIGNCACCF